MCLSVHRGEEVCIPASQQQSHGTPPWANPTPRQTRQIPPAHLDTHPLRQTPPSQIHTPWADTLQTDTTGQTHTQTTSGQYASYWNAFLFIQGGHGTGKTRKTGILVLTFSRQGKHREFCFDTWKNFETQGKYFSVTQGKI